MQQLHLGSGTTNGALTVFPVWGEYAGHRGYSLDVNAAWLGEQSGGAQVSTLSVTNSGTRPLLMLEGQLLEGGLQNRVVDRSVLIPARAEMGLGVLCVEAGRWGGGSEHQAHGRRASLRVRSALVSDGERQVEVWKRVQEYESSYGANDTSSLAGYVDRAGADVDRLVEGFRPLFGQVGVVLGIAGQPVMAEVFDSPSTLSRQFRSIVRAAALDALGQEPLTTPSRRARRFLDRASRVPRTAVAPAGVGTTVAGADSYANVSALAWRRRDVHLVATNPRHTLCMAGAQ
jgi:hypothetical protein